MTLEARDLACLKGDRLLFQHLYLCVGKGEILRIAGGNGCGKTSLLRILCGLSLPEVGQVLWQDQPIRKQRDQFHAQLLYVGHAPALNERLTPFENLQFACASAGDHVDSEAIHHALDLLGLASRTHLALRHLSQGQRKRVSLARLWLAAHRLLWVLDEPFAALDTTCVALLSKHIERHCDAGGMVLLTTHQEGDFTRAIPVLTLNATMESCT